MLKKISVGHLKLGMYVHELCGSWMEHPFWRNQFLLEDPQDLHRIQSTNINEVWIDTAKGIDVPEGIASVSREQANAQADATLIQHASEHSSSIHASELPPLDPQQSMAQELRRAASICTQGQKAIISMFQEARMGQAIDAGTARSLVKDISDSVQRNPNALLSLARLKTADNYTYMHSVAVSALMMALARHIGMDDEATHIAGMAGLLHDLGKVKTPLEVLNKPGKLTDAEFAIMRAHPEHSYAMLQDAQLHPQVLDACLHHHEKINGTGYPHKLQGDAISVLARMTAICDVYDAITSNRPYKSGWDPSESLRRMAEWTKDHFDSRLFQAFVKTIGIYPVGSLVRLTSGRLGIVTEQSGRALLTPHVKVFFSTKSGLRIPPEMLDLSTCECHEKIVAREDPTHWNFPDLDELWSGL